MYKDRLRLYERLENEFKGKVLAYITGDRPGFGTSIAGDVIDPFINHLDTIGSVETILLYLYTRGGDTASAWNIINLIKMFCDKLIVIVPHKAHSAGTIITLGANEIVMTKQATLSPIDPSLNTELNPKVDNNRTSPVSVEAVNGFIEFAKKEFDLTGQDLVNVLEKLTDFVHPLVLGQVYRSRGQIKMLAKRLLENQIRDQSKIDKIISFLCSESGSHDYTINRREAKTNLGLNVVNPTAKQYETIKMIYADFSDELGLNSNSTFIPNDMFSVRSAFLESIAGGSDFFVYEGRMQLINNGQSQRIDTFRGWRHNNPESEVNDSVETIKAGITYERDTKFGL